MRTLRAGVDHCLGWLLVALMAIAVANVLWQVFTRFVLVDPSSFTEEAARYLLVWISVIGAAYAAGRQMHLAIDLLPRKLSGRPAGAALGAAISACVFAFALGVLVIGGIALVTTTLTRGQLSPALGLKVGYVYLALPISGAIMMFYAVADVLERLARRAADTSPPEASSP